MGTQWPVVMARLVALLPTLPGWSDDPVAVFDGAPIGDVSAGSLCTVGYVDGDDAGQYSESLAPVGNVFTFETGEVRCRLLVATGDATLSAVRAKAFALVDALRASMRADPLLGVLPAGSTTSMTVGVGSVQNEQGAGQRLDFTVSYSCPVI